MAETENLDYFGDAQLADPKLRAWDGGNSAAPPGEYEFKIVSYEKKASGDSGKPRLVLKCEIVTEGEQKGRTMQHGFMLTGDVGKDGWRSRLKHIATVCAVKVDEKGGFYFAHLIGKHFIGEVVHGSYDKVDPTTGVTKEALSINIQQERPAGGKPAAGMRANGIVTNQQGPRL